MLASGSWDFSGLAADLKGMACVMAVGVAAAYAYNWIMATVSQQVNFVINAMAGAERVFRLMDETPEEGAGMVELVSVREAEDGRLAEASERTG